MEKDLVAQETEIQLSAKEVYDFVREKLAPTVKEQRAKVEEALEKVQSITTIETNDEYVAALEANKVLKKARADAKKTLEDMKTKAHSVHKAFTSSQNEIDKDGDTEYNRLGRLASAYDQEQERLRLKKQRELEAKAHKEAEEAQLAEAAAAEEAGDKEGAEEIINEPVHAAPVEIAKSTPTVDNVHYRDNWKFEIVNASKIPAEYLVPDEVKIGKIVKAMKADTKIDGIKVFNDRKPVDRS